MPFITNEGVNIHYKVEGQGPGVILQHGFFGSMEDWYEYGYVDALKDDYQVILVDARGHGKSEKLYEASQYAPYLRAKDIITVMDAVGVEKSHYIGYSMGGWISFGLMRWFSDRFKSFILNGAHPFPTDLDNLRGAVQTLEEWVPQFKTSEANKKRLLNNDKKALLAAIEEKRVDNTEVVINVKVPCLMLAGEEDALLENARAGAALTPLAKFEMIPGADHGDSLYCSHLTIPMIQRFLMNVSS